MALNDTTRYDHALAHAETLLPSDPDALRALARHGLRVLDALDFDDENLADVPERGGATLTPSDAHAMLLADETGAWRHEAGRRVAILPVDDAWRALYADDAAATTLQLTETPDGLFVARSSAPDEHDLRGYDLHAVLRGAALPDAAAWRQALARVTGALPLHGGYLYLHGWHPNVGGGELHVRAYTREDDPADPAALLLCALLTLAPALGAPPPVVDEVHAAWSADDDQPSIHRALTCST